MNVYVPDGFALSRDFNRHFNFPPSWCFSVQRKSCNDEISMIEEYGHWKHIAISTDSIRGKSVIVVERGNSEWKLFCVTNYVTSDDAPTNFKGCPLFLQTEVDRPYYRNVDRAALNREDFFFLGLLQWLPRNDKIMNQWYLLDSQIKS